MKFPNKLLNLQHDMTHPNPNGCLHSLEVLHSFEVFKTSPKIKQITTNYQFNTNYKTLNTTHATFLSFRMFQSAPVQCFEYKT